MRKMLWSIAIYCVSLSATLPVWGQTGVFRLSPDRLTVSTNWQFSMDLRLDINDVALGGYKVFVSYDPNVLRLLEVRPMPGTWFPADISVGGEGSELGYVPIEVTRTGTVNPEGDNLTLTLRWAACGNSGDSTPVTVEVESLMDFWSQPVAYAVSNALVNIDSGDDDSDGLPNWYEELQTGSLTGMSAVADLDLDGVDNRDEFMAGTDPWVKSSLPGLEMDMSSDHAATFLTCEGNRSRQYRFMTSTNLASGIWQDMATFVPESDGTISLNQPVTDPLSFYRYSAMLPVYPSVIAGESNRLWTTALPTDFSPYGPVLYRLFPSNIYTLVRLAQSSTNEFRFDFDLSRAGTNRDNRWAGAMLYFTNKVFDFTTNAIVLGLNAGGATRVKLEVEDVNKEKAAVWLDKIGRTPHRYRVCLADLGMVSTGSLTSASIRSVSVVADESTVGWHAAQGFVTVSVGGLVRSADPPVIEGQLYSTNVLTDFGTFYPGVVAWGFNTVSGAPPGTVALTQYDNSRFSYSYDLERSSSGFVFASIARGWGLFFRLAQNGYIFAAKGTVGQRVRVEVQDADKIVYRAIVILSDQYQNYELTWPSAPAGPDRLRIQAINFVHDWSVGSSEPEGEVWVQTGPMSYVSPPVLIAGSPYAPEELTDMSARTNAYVDWYVYNHAPGQPECNISVTQSCAASTLSISYDLRLSSSSVAEVDVGFSNISMPGGWTIAASGKAGDRVRVRIYGGSVCEVVLELGDTLQNYCINWAAVSPPSGFDPAKINDISFLQDWNLGSTNHIGEVHVQIPGFFCRP